LVGTPQPGTSTLYWGQFVDESTTNLPVHLDINHAIKITLPFVANSYGSHTNNGALRFGLFDYADGGTLIAADGTAAAGSAGNGAKVMGYMLSVDFGPTFTANSPLSLLVRTSLSDNNLMGTTADYTSMGSGPAGGGYTGAEAFVAGTTYTLVFQVTRTAINAVSVAATITNGVGAYWSWTAAETNNAYHRFDVFAMRPEKVETTADTFTIPEFKVEVLSLAPVLQSITTTSVSRNGNNVTLTWNPNPAGTYSYSVLRKLSLSDATWTTLQSGISTTNYTDTTATGGTGFYRVSSP
jgi:hypothetical protein